MEEAQWTRLADNEFGRCELDVSTAIFYSTNAATCAARYDVAKVGPLHVVLRSLATSTSRVLEIGGGSGRDAAFLVQLGCDTTYTDGCKEMVAQALERHPELASRARCAAFPLPENHELLRERFELILCAAVIMHLDDPSLERSVLQVAGLIANDGYLVLSHSRGHRNADSDRDSCGRLFRERSPAVVDRILQKSGLQTVQLIENADGLGREQITWTTHVMRKTH